MHPGPRDGLLNIGVGFRDGLSSEEVERIISVAEETIESGHSESVRVFTEARSRRDHLRSLERQKAVEGTGEGS